MGGAGGGRCACARACARRLLMYGPKKPCLQFVCITRKNRYRHRARLCSMAKATAGGSRRVLMALITPPAIGIPHWHSSICARPQFTAAAVTAAGPGQRHGRSGAASVFVRGGGGGGGQGGEKALRRAPRLGARAGARARRAVSTATWAASLGYSTGCWWTAALICAQDLFDDRRSRAQIGVFRYLRCVGGHHRHGVPTRNADLSQCRCKAPSKVQGSIW